MERWYYAARKAADPVATLKNRLRGGISRFPSLSQTVIDTLTQQYREHPGWTAQLHFDNLCAAFKGSDTTVASYPTVRRYLKAQGMFRQARPKRATAGALAARDRLERLEVRSFEVDHVGALWHLDFHHGSRKVLTRSGQWVTPMIMCVIDDRSRLVCHLQWYLDETAQSLIHCLCQALMKRGLPRALMTDNGAAMLAEETTSGLAALGIVHQTTLPYSPYQNAKQESFWGRIEGRLMAMLEGDEGLTLDALNLATQAWTEQEYHRTHHSEINATPMAHYLAGPNVARSCVRAVPCWQTASASRWPAARGARTARSVWVVHALRYRGDTAIWSRSTCVMPAGICRGLIWSITEQAPSCVRSSRSISPPMPMASVAP
jgi:transposase InsO family protein